MPATETFRWLVHHNGQLGGLKTIKQVSIVSQVTSAPKVVTATQPVQLSTSGLRQLRHKVRLFMAYDIASQAVYAQLKYLKTD